MRLREKATATAIVDNRPITSLVNRIFEAILDTLAYVYAIMPNKYMEVDLVTRVYGFKGTFQREEATVLSPAHQAGERIYRGNEAKAIFNRADFKLIPYTTNTGQGEKQGYHVYRAPFTPGSDSFNIDATNWRVPRDSVQGYQRIPQEIHIRAHEKQPTRGLTIVVLK